jgi:GT2 family glycosyltransferase
VTGLDERTLALSIVIPTFERHEVLIETIERFLTLDPAPDEIVVVDQTKRHPEATEAKLLSLEREGRIRRFRRDRPSIPAAMNEGLLRARGRHVAFSDDDVVPAPGFVRAHCEAHAELPESLIAGQILQPGESAAPLTGPSFRLSSSVAQPAAEIGGGNFSAPTRLLTDLGGFDERFVGAAYRYERELCERARRAGVPIFFEPRASIRHLRAARGGTRSWGDHLRTIRPAHAVGEYYYLLRAKDLPARWRQLASRPLRAVRTRHHLRHPWWIPATFVAELLGFGWALLLAARGPALLGGRGSVR